MNPIHPTITNGSKFVFELGPSSDLVTVAGSLIFSGSGQAIFDIVDAGIVAGNDYTLVGFSSSNGLALGNLSFGNTPAGSGSFNVSADSISLHVTNVPEPSSILLLGMACLGLVPAIRRFRKPDKVW